MPNQTELNDKYGNNLSVTSNDPAIIQRDQSGNISIESNKTVYIEPITWAYNNDSINKIIDTRFSYYKFPPRVILDDANVSADIGIDDIGISYNSRYKAEPQFIPTIELLLPNPGSNEINYGWNYPNTTNPEISKPASPQLQNATKYYKAQLTASLEIKTGTSLGRFKRGLLPNTVEITSLFEGYFRKINFTEVIDGMPQIQPASFVITQDLINSGKSFEFNIQVAVSHLDDNKRNTFAIRLIRTRTNATAREPYEVLKMVSSLEQGSKETNDVSDDLEALAKIKIELDAHYQVLTKSQTQIKELQNSIITLRNNSNQANKEYQVILNKFAVAPTVYYKELAQAKKDRDSSKKLLDDTEEITIRLVMQLGNIRNKYNETKKRYDDAQRPTNLPSSNSPEGILNSQYAYLRPGKTYFTLSWTLETEDMRLNDIYSIEMLASTPYEYAHELIEENTFWDIKEIMIDTEYTIEDEKLKWKAVEADSTRNTVNTFNDTFNNNTGVIADNSGTINANPAVIGTTNTNTFTTSGTSTSTTSTSTSNVVVPSTNTTSTTNTNNTNNGAFEGSASQS